MTKHYCDNCGHEKAQHTKKGKCKICNCVDFERGRIRTGGKPYHASK